MIFERMLPLNPLECGTGISEIKVTVNGNEKILFRLLV